MSNFNLSTVSTAGRATIFTVVTAVFCFAVAFFFNLGAPSFDAVVAASDNIATTSVTVVNTPPQFVVDAEEEAESSGVNPTNSGDEVAFVATASDPNGESYFLLICSTNATPTPASNAPPVCGAGATQWAISATTTSGVQARAATTTQETATSLFNESNDWYAFVCDFNAGTPRCSTDIDQQGTGLTASPFKVNNRPTFTAFSNNGPVNPDGTITFSATASDTDVDTVNDTVKLIVCSTSNFSTSTNTCDDTTLATSTFSASDPAAAYTLTPPMPDTAYNAFPFVIDQHGHEAAGSFQGVADPFTVNNVAPYVDGSTISINGGADMILTVEAGETTGFTLDFEVNDNNSCLAIGSTTEITNYQLSLYRDGTGNSSTTCSTNTAGDYDANDCYTSAAAPTVWNLSCTASSTACTGYSDLNTAYSCTFPLWYIADPTDGTSTSTQYSTDDWKVQVLAIDDDFATGTPAEATSPVEVRSFLAFDLLSFLIPYGSLEPGQNTDDVQANLGAGAASTTIQATGNVGLDELLSGQSMCPTYTGPGTECANSETSTIQDFRQVFSATSTHTYALASSTGYQLSSTTDKELELNVFKSTSTSTPATGITYWGIQIPASISLSGDYTGQNTFIAVVGESSHWQ